MHKERTQELNGRSMELPLPVWSAEEKDATFRIAEISEEDLQCREKELRERIPLVLPIPNWHSKQDRQVSKPPIEIRDKRVNSDDRPRRVPPELPMILPLFPWNLYSNYSATSGLLVSNTASSSQLSFNLSSPPAGSQSDTTTTPSYSSNYATQAAPICYPNSTLPQLGSGPWSSHSSGSNLPPGPRARDPGVSVHDFSSFPQGQHTASTLPPMPPLIASASLSKTISCLPANGLAQAQLNQLRPQTFENISCGMSNSSSRQAMTCLPLLDAPGEQRVHPPPLIVSVPLPNESNRTSAQPPRVPTMNSVAASTPSPSSSQGAAPHQSGSSLQNQERQGSKKRHLPLLPTPTFVQSNSSQRNASSMDQGTGRPNNQQPLPGASASKTQKCSKRQFHNMVLLPKLLPDALVFKMPYSVANTPARPNESSPASSEALSQMTFNGYGW